MQSSKIDLQDGSKIQINKGFEKKIGLAHIKIERLKKKKISTYIFFGFCMITGIILIYSQRDLLVGFDFTYSKYLIFARSFLLVLLGFGFSSVGFNKLKDYRKKRKTVKEEKEKIDKVLNQYQIKYSCNIEFGEKYHGVQDVIVEIKSNSDLLKNSKSTYQV
ncbi:hypothetical protein TMP248_150082 [Tenacibaculum maritimum]|uniref:hypothetical protein n=1 Tax=Tenacibaculum maritimum TaxID=107401 RepID=UPI0012E47AAD|nr:hypothetical protein [Tenacibaculum maritimum]CAA0177824.1 hypothetical protein TMP248_150075 [Tenacibaculum maritimum]CAA0178043.1 hypothetical protein TMP248_150082 [Tenacibaculum maritimum]